MKPIEQEHFLQTDDYMVLEIPAGTEFQIPNPFWDDNDVRTQYDVKIRLDVSAFCNLIGGNYKYTIVAPADNALLQVLKNSC